MSYSIDELEDHFSDCLDKVDDSVEDSDKGRIVLPVIFFKCVADTYESERNQVLESVSDSNPDLVEELSETELLDKFADDFRVDLPENKRWQDLMSADRKDRFLDQVLNDIQDDEKYRGICSTNFAAYEMDKDELAQLVVHLDDNNFNLSLEENDPKVIGSAFRSLIKELAEVEDKDAGIYYQPDGIIDIISRIFGPFEKGEKFYDPKVGSGDMLIGMAEHYENHQGEDIDKLDLKGQESNKIGIGLAKQTFFMHDIIYHQDLDEADPLREPAFVDDGELVKFDYVLSNFPYSESWDKEPDNSFKRFNWVDKLPRKDRGDYAFIEHMEATMADDGMMAAVVPHGVLFREKEGVFREHMIENNWVEAVIGMPESLFGEATDIAPALLILNKDKEDDRSGEVLFIHAGSKDVVDFYDELDNKNEMKEDGISKIAEIYDTWSSIERVSRTVSIEELQENEYNLNIALYVDTTEPEEDIDVVDNFLELERMEEELDERKEKLRENMKCLYDID